MFRLRSFLIGLFAGIISTGLFIDKTAWPPFLRLKKKEKENYRALTFMDQWIKEKQEGRNICDILKKKGVKNVAIYKGSRFSYTLERELGEIGINITAYIDDDDNSFSLNYPVISVANIGGAVIDAIIITEFTNANSIKKQISNNTDIPVILLEDMILRIE